MEIIHARLIEGYYGDRANNEWTTWFDEINIITKFEKAEFQIAKDTAYEKNDFEIQLNAWQFKNFDIKYKDWIYIPETEFGGRIDIINHEEDSIVKIGGPNFRCILNKSVIWPKYNSSLNARDDYLIISNTEANKAIDILCDNVYFSSYARVFRVSNNVTDKYLSLKARYEYLCDKIVSTLSDNQMRLKITHSYETDTVPLKIEAVPCKRYDELYNSDFDIEINSKVDSTNEVNTILALGRGELHERTLLLINHIKNDKEDRFVASSPLSSNVLGSIYSSMYVYDYPNCESDEDLADKAIEEFKKEHLKTEEITLSVKDSKIELNLGDIVSGYDEITDLYIETEITQKTLTITNSKTNYVYKVGD